MRRVIAIVLLVALLPAIAVGASVSIFADHTDDEIMTAYTELTAEMQRRGLLVYISPTGEKFHTRQECGSMKEAIAITTAQAVDAGYEPCKKCFKPKENKE